MLDCGIDCPSTSDYMIDFVLHFGWRYPSYRGGLPSLRPRTPRSACFSASAATVARAGTPLAPADFQAGLLAVRGQIQAQGTPFGTYYIPGTQHIWLMSDSGFATTVNGVALKQWLADLLAGSVSHVGP